MKHKKILAITLLLSFVLAVPAGCGKKRYDKDGNMLQLQQSEMLREEGLFIRVEDENGGTVFQPLVEPGELGYMSFAEMAEVEDLKGSSSRYIMLANMDHLIPMITGTNILVYAEDDAIVPEYFQLEKFTDCGYTFGGTLSSSEEQSGLQLGKMFVKNSNFKSVWGDRNNFELYILESIGGVKIGENNLDSNGVFQGLAKDTKYEFSSFVGTKYEAVTCVADTHYFVFEKAIRMNQKDCVVWTTNGFVIVKLPKDLESGFYLVNGTGLFYYDEKGTKDIPLTDRFSILETEPDPDETAETTEDLYVSKVTDINNEPEHDEPGD